MVRASFLTHWNCPGFIKPLCGNTGFTQRFAGERDRSDTASLAADMAALMPSPVHEGRPLGDAAWRTVGRSAAPLDGAGLRRWLKAGMRLEPASYFVPAWQEVCQDASSAKAEVAALGKQAAAPLGSQRARLDGQQAPGQQLGGGVPRALTPMPDPRLSV